MTQSTASHRPRTGRAAALVGIAAVAALLASCGSDSGSGPAAGSPSPTAPAAGSTTPAASGSHLASAPLADTTGANKGTVEFSEVDGQTRVEARVTGLTPGFHGLHVHTIGTCEPDSAAPDKPEEKGAFLSAGGHLKGTGPDGATHPGHAGDLPPILVNADGTGTLVAVTDRLTRENLLDSDGSAAMIHEKSDNLSNIPDRYKADGADEETLMAGDGGKRAACGVLRQ